MCRGFRRFVLDVCEDNTRAIELYESLGFRVSAQASVEGLRYASMRLEQRHLRELLRKGLQPHGRQPFP
jgi:ribosomal protein S18 acetylase RimI-like enzyme